MSEKRQNPRQQTNSYIGIYDNTSGRIVGCLVDLTTEGMRIVCEIPLDVGARYSLALDLPESLCDEGRLTVEAINIWVKEGTSPGFYLAGFELERPSPEMKNRLEKLLQSSLFRQYRETLTGETDS